ncbi:Signal transducer regulating beta-lactamase production, contains metallopeptidase domain [Mucilaginibacter gossypiicola]|uniref:Signal transducer regulating beta-lactamase production, contains metallopeptidase domain n=1 Tax=Mucilaginibacter gossypiicola TaxID=551995 RepID=A0A1H8QSL7_9SPHI|nr:M56 family metallopeptidase [Mucilaginibacter gossypiicola]SEO57027.1 Signal transducer regulating beta-lactamase production, contains metallopeptidase domain [Mucilaginibacter gossypiicola]
MIPYLLYVAMLLAVCLLFYKLLLQRETFYRLNRYILLCCLGFCFLTPIIRPPAKWSVQKGEEPVNQPALIQQSQQTETFEAKLIEEPAQKTILTPEQPDKTTQAVTAKPQPKPTLSVTQVIKWLLILYWAGVIIFALNLLVQIGSTLYQAFTSSSIIDGRYRIVELNGNKVPCSFFNYIFINPAAYDWDTYSQILLHEKVHAKQLHSLDIILAELCIVFQWFNPFAWLYRKEMENNLEYLTDTAVLNSVDTDKAAYQLSLLKVSVPEFSLRIATNYNQSLLKKRITMMNAKRSNLHILWKYFTLLPLFCLFICALNQPVNSAQSTNSSASFIKPVANNASAYKNFDAEVEGYWFAARDGDNMNMDFKVTTKGHNWNYNSFNVPMKALSSMPRKQKGDFTLTRDAGTILFNGKFDGDEGLGRFKLKPNKAYVDMLQKEGLEQIELHELLDLLLTNVEIDYLEKLKKYGYTAAKVNDLTALRYFGGTENDMRFWRAQYKDITLSDLTRIKINKLDSSFVSEMRNAGYRNLTLQQLTSFKSQKITPEYIRSIVSARKIGRAQGDTTSLLPPPDELLSARYAKVDSTYLRGLISAGYNLTGSQLHSFKVYNVTLGYIDSLKTMGYSNLTFADMIGLRSQNITVDFIKQYRTIGFNDIPADYLPSFKRYDISPEFIKSYQSMGYKNIKASELVLIKTRGITADYIKSFQNLGYKDIELADIISMKHEDITPDFIKGFNDLGFKNVPVKDLILLKMADVTPQYVSSMKQKGLNSKDLHKYINLKNSFN